MTYQERATWAYGVIAVVGYAVYLVLLLTSAAETPFPETPYIVPMLATIGGGIVAGIVNGIILGMLTPKGRAVTDERDVAIDHFGERVGNAFVVIGALAALVLAMLDAHTFWIANVLYLGFVLSAVLGVMAKLGAYRRGF